MSIDPAGRLDLAPELRMVSHTYREVFGRPPATLWRVPGTVTLLADGPVRLTVATPWGAIAAAGPRDDDVIELIRMQQPGERERVTIRQAAAGLGPAWAGAELWPDRRGAMVLVSSGLPEGSGMGAGAATEMAIRLCLGDAADPDPSEDSAVAGALLEKRHLPFDLGAAGLRLMIIDTRVRGAVQPAPAEHSPVEAAAAAISVGDMTTVGSLLTAAHKALDCDDAQHIAVSAAIKAGAYGARMITDGPGRPACVLAPVGRLADVRGEVCACFARRRLRPPRFLTFTPARGPQRMGFADRGSIAAGGAVAT